MRLAAIDIGSNAARLLISEVTTKKNEEPEFTKLNLVRVPLRLGFDVFEKGKIGRRKIEVMVQTMKAFSHLMKAYGVKKVLACATSAMREAENQHTVIKEIREKTGIRIQVISGDQEAMYIYENHVAEHLEKDHAYLYVDVGGGSTELTFFNEGKLVYKKSFDIGTIRLLKNKVSEQQWKELKIHLKTFTQSKLSKIAIGSGGSINKIFTLSKRKEDRPLSISLLKEYYNQMSTLTVDERMRDYKIRDDRADVIVPALKIYIRVMQWAGIDEIFVPKVGLADGLIQHQFYTALAKQRKRKKQK